MEKQTVKSVKGNREKHSLKQCIKWLVLCCCTHFSNISVADHAPDDARSLKIGVALRPVYVHMSDYGEVYGTDVDRANTIFEEAGFKISYRIYPWKRILHLLENGQIDVALSASDTDDRRVFAHFSEQPFRLGHNVFFTKKANIKKYGQISSLKELRNKPIRIAVLRGVTYSREYEVITKDPEFFEKLVIVDTPERQLELLKFDRVDALIGSEQDQLNEIKNQGLQDSIVPVFYLMSDKEAASHIMYSKKTVSEQWVNEIDEAIKRLRAKGEIPLNPAK